MAYKYVSVREFASAESVRTHTEEGEESGRKRKEGRVKEYDKERRGEEEMEMESRTMQSQRRKRRVEKNKSVGPQFLYVWGKKTKYSKLAATPRAEQRKKEGSKRQDFCFSAFSAGRDAKTERGRETRQRRELDHQMEKERRNEGEE